MKKQKPQKQKKGPVLTPTDVKYCNTTHVQMTQEEAILAFQSGPSVYAFAFNPSHIKRLAERLNEAIKNYEKLMGPIDTHQTPPKA